MLDQQKEARRLAEEKANERRTRCAYTCPKCNRVGYIGEDHECPTDPTPTYEELQMEKLKAEIRLINAQTMKLERENFPVQYTGGVENPHWKV